MLSHGIDRRRAAIGASVAAGLALSLIVAGLVFMGPSPALSQAVEIVKLDVEVVAKGHRTSKLVGATVVNDKNEKIGAVDDIVVDRNRVLAAVLQVGGFLGVGGKLIAVPYDSLQVDEGSNKIVLPGASKEELKRLAEFKYRV
jgi:sporulation protein YlmC with PRC-barrel domain